MLLPPTLFHLEHYTIIRDIVQALLGRESVSGYDGAGPENMDIIRAFESPPADLLLLGINSNELPLHFSKAITIIRQLKNRFPSLKIIAHSVYSDSCHVMELIKAGISGFVNKALGYDSLQTAISEISQGRRYISEKEASNFHNARAFMACRTDKLKPRSKLFSNREMEVLGFIAKGYSTNEMAEQLCLSDRTIETHRKNLVAKSDVKNTAELMVFSHTIGLL